MGQSVSHSHYQGCLPSSTTSPSTSTTYRRRGFRSPFLRRKKHKFPLSATFQAPCSNNFEALNINTATVEQFMTLPGIDRRIAQSIVDHRAAVGGLFQRVDDLALVSGIGAERLEQIRREICIKKASRSIQGSSMSSRTPSLDSILSEPNASLSNAYYKTRLNINTSTVFQLQQLPGMNQELAANVIDYRHRKGPFKSLDQLVKVKGISHGRLGAIRSLLCIQDDETTAGSEPKSTAPKLQNGFATSRHRKSTSMPIQMCLEASNGFINAPVNDIFDLLGAYSHRPVIKDDFTYQRNGHAALRIASWNLDRMCMEKSSNLGVREVVCRTILENRLSIVCLQEIYESAALQLICDELNSPKLRRCIDWKENPRNWKYLTNISESDSICVNGLGLLYDASRCELVNDECFDIHLTNCALDETFGVAPTAFLTTFQFADWKCPILNVYLRYYDLNSLDEVITAIESALQRCPGNPKLSDIFMVAGDFTGMNKDHIDHVSMPLLSSTTVQAAANGDNNIVTEFVSNKAPAAAAVLNSNLERLGFCSTFEPNVTSFSRDQLYKSNSDVFSSCNILCRERMPSTRSAFREALYKAKSPLSIYNQEVPFDGEKLCGYYGVIRDGLCHMAIPRGWLWGGPASEHCPIWVDVYMSIGRRATTVANNKSCNNTIATDSMRRRPLRRNSLTSCRSLKLPSPVNAADAATNVRNKLERGITIPIMMTGRADANGDCQSIFYDANDSTDAINGSNTSSSNNSINNNIILSNGKRS